MTSYHYHSWTTVSQSSVDHMTLFTGLSSFERSNKYQNSISVLKIKFIAKITELSRMVTFSIYLVFKICLHSIRSFCWLGDR